MLKKEISPLEHQPGVKNDLGALQFHHVARGRFELRCGSTPAPIMPTNAHPVKTPPTSFTMSVTMVVVATTFILAAVA